jgi:Pyruvate/2-oxoacid:ferredoxin oxidoreductase gamma subunit
METLGAAITNTAMLGAFAMATGAVKLESLI